MNRYFPVFNTPSTAPSFIYCVLRAETVLESTWIQEGVSIQWIQLAEYVWVHLALIDYATFHVVSKESTRTQPLMVHIGLWWEGVSMSTCEMEGVMLPWICGPIYLSYWQSPRWEKSTSSSGTWPLPWYNVTHVCVIKNNNRYWSPCLGIGTGCQWHSYVPRCTQWWYGCNAHCRATESYGVRLHLGS